LHGVVEFLLTHGSVFGEGRIALYIQLGFELRGFGAVNLGLGGVDVGSGLRQSGVGNVELRLGLIDDRLEGARVDFEQQVSGLDQGSFLIIMG
jgi:hypothetical protein